MTKSIDLILGAVKSAGEAALRLYEENKVLEARLAEAERLLREASDKIAFSPFIDLRHRIDAFICKADSASVECDHDWTGLSHGTDNPLLVCKKCRATQTVDLATELQDKGFPPKPVGSR